MTSSEPPGYYCDIYLGDADAIGRACAAGDWDALRDGRAASAYVEFPQVVGNSDLPLVLPTVLGKVTGGTSMPPLPEFERCLAGDYGMWGAEQWPRTYVDAVAAVPQSDTGQLTEAWVRAVLTWWGEEYDQQEWHGPELRQAVADFVALCKQAVETGDDVIQVWTM